MGRHARKAQKRDAQAAGSGQDRGQGRAPARPAPPASASLPAGNAVPVQRQEALPEHWSALPEESRSVRLRVPAQARSWENDQNDRVQFSITDADGRQRTWSFSGVDRASRALCRPILSCGVIVVLIVIAIVGILAHSSMQEKVICGLGSAVVAGFVWAGTQVKLWLKRRWGKRRGKASGGDVARG